MVRKHVLTAVALIAAVSLAQAVTIQVKRGPQATVPAKLKMGEMGVTTDSQRAYMGYSTGKKEIAFRDATFAHISTAAMSGGSGTVTSVTGTAPIVSSGGTAPAISINPATTGSAGSMSAADKAKLDAITGTNTGNETATSIGTIISGATAKTAPVDADAVAIMDSAAGNVAKKTLWSSIKATLKSYFDTLYHAATVTFAEVIGSPTDNAALSTALAGKHSTASFTLYSTHRAGENIVTRFVAYSSHHTGTGSTVALTNAYPSTSTTTAATPDFVRQAIYANSTSAFTYTVPGAANKIAKFDGADGLTQGVAIPTCTGTDKLTSNGSTFTCAADQTGTAGSGITSLGGLTASSQSFANDTNVTMTSTTSTHTLGWTGTLAKSRGGTGADLSSVTFPITGTIATEHTTLAGYGISDAYTTAYLDAALNGKLGTATAASTYKTQASFTSYSANRVTERTGTDGTYGWTTSSNTSAYSDCGAGKYGFNWIGGTLYQCVNGVNTVFSGGSMTYPGAGIPVSTGSAWTTSLPAPPGNTTTFMRGDGTWATPPAGGGSGGTAETVATYSSDTTIRNGNYYRGTAKAKLTFRNHSTGVTRIFANYTTTVATDAATSKFQWPHPALFTNNTTAAGYSVKIPPQTRVEVVSDGSGTFQLVPTQPLVKTGVNEYAGGGYTQFAANTATLTASQGFGSTTTFKYVGQKVNAGASTHQVRRLDVYVRGIVGSIATNTFTAQIHTMSAQTLTAIKGTSNSLAGSSVTTGTWISFIFPSPVALDAGDAFTVTAANYDASNYMQLGTISTDSDGGYSYFIRWSDTGAAQDAQSGKDIGYILYE